MTYATYGPPEILRLEEVEKPIPGDEDVLVRVHAAAVNFGDWALLRGKPFVVRLMDGGLRRPKNPILGADIAGRVEAVGGAVEQFQPGDRISSAASSTMT